MGYDFNVCLCSMVSIIKKSSRDPHLFAAFKKKAEAIGLHSINLMLEPSLPYRSGYSLTMAANTGFK